MTVRTSNDTKREKAPKETAQRTRGNGSNDNALLEPTTTSTPPTDQELWQGICQNNPTTTTNTTNNINTTSCPANDDDDDRNDENNNNNNDSNMHPSWFDSCYATGFTKATWKDETLGWRETCLTCWSGSARAHILCTALFCQRAGRVGNMVVLRETMDHNHIEEEDDDEQRQQQQQRRKLRWVVGPYWMITVCLTVPGLVGYALLAGFSRNIWDQSPVWFYLWLCLNSLALFSLFQVSCSDPGIMYRHAEPKEESWLWNDQAMTYRPPHARFDPECGVMIAHFDHTCPWTGTGIGGNNMRWFRLFLWSVLGALIINTGALAYLSRVS